MNKVHHFLDAVKPAHKSAYRMMLWESIPVVELARTLWSPVFLVNACYCVLPILESYLSWLCLPRRACRWVLFVVAMYTVGGATVAYIQDLVQFG